jgi:sugar-specific transcriptional regulator TrmB
MVNTLRIEHYFEKFGLEKIQADVYVQLLKLRTATVVELSRETNINRTTLYRILEALEKKGLVKTLLGHKTTKYQAENPEKLEGLILQEEEKIHTLRNSLSQIQTQLHTLIPVQPSSTEVLYFQGKEGLKQMLWNTLNAGENGEIVGFGYLSLNEGAGRFFAEKIRREYIDNNIKRKELLNIDQIEPEENYTDFASEYRKVYEGRGIEKEKIEIYHDLTIYNDVVTFWHVLNDELFGVEIHNAVIAKMQKQIFHILWEMAKTKEEILGKYF